MGLSDPWHRAECERASVGLPNCPFCNSPATVDYWSLYDRRNEFRASCSKCENVFQSGWTAEEAAAKWHRGSRGYDFGSHQTTFPVYRSFLFFDILSYDYSFAA